MDVGHSILPGFEFVLSNHVVNLLDVGPREKVASARFPHAAVVGGLGEAEVVVVDCRG